MILFYFHNFPIIIIELSGVKMIILHDSPSSDLRLIQAMARIQEDFSLFDYVRIEQSGKSWIGQIIQPNRNISIVGNPLNPTILHGLELMEQSNNVQTVESVQVFNILILGEYTANQMSTLRLRPLPGAAVSKLDPESTIRVLGTPNRQSHKDGGINVIGELLNAPGVPLCVNDATINHHIMIAGGTGSGKSNVASNLIEQAVKYHKCVLIHDAKPDYGLITTANCDPGVRDVWHRFKKYGMEPHSADTIINDSMVLRVGFKGKCNPNEVDILAGCIASDLSPLILAGFFFPETNEQLQFEGFASAADSLNKPYSLDDILQVIKERMRPSTSVDSGEQIHKSTGDTILRKVNFRRSDMSWLDVVGEKDPINGKKIVKFNFEDSYGRVLVIDYSQMDDSSYALLLSFVLNVCQDKRNKRKGVGILQMIDEAHRIFDNESRHSDTLTRLFNRIMREGRTYDHSIILSLQNASQIPQSVMNNLNTHIVLRQNSKNEADYATQTMGSDYSARALELGTGHALIKLFESNLTVPVQMAPSPFELIRNDNTIQTNPS